MEGDKTMSSDTPRADAHNWNEGHYDDPLHSLLDFAKQLERELNAANERIRRLEEAGDQLAKWVDRNTPVTILNDWTAAKEAKP